MVTQMINIKLDDSFLKEIDSIVADSNYHNRTEFIRNALREKLDKVKLEQTMKELSKFRRMSSHKTTEEEYEKIRTLAFKKLSKKFE